MEEFHAPTSTDDLMRQVTEFIVAGEKDAADSIIEAWALQYGHLSAFETIIEPVLEEIGSRWDKEPISLAAGYLASKIAEDTLIKAMNEQPVAKNFKGTAIIGNIEDDYHSLGRKMVGVFLKTSGWNVIDLGNDVTAEAFVDAAVENNAHIIGVSSMIFTKAGNIKKVREEIAVSQLKNLGYDE